MDSDYHTSSLIIREADVEEYKWDFNIPPRSRMQKNIEQVASGGFRFHGLKFKTGFLSGIDHKWGLTFFSNQINILFSLPSRDRHHRYTFNSCFLQLISNGRVKERHALGLERDQDGPLILYSSVWVNSSRSWDDSVDMIRVVFRITREFNGVCRENLVSRNEASTEHSSSKTLDASEFFQNPHLSDVTLQCQGESIPGHRFLLSLRSPVFAQMFQAGMKEQQEGVVVINDFEPAVLKLLLKFMYCDKVDFTKIPDNLCSELLQGAEKYNLDALKALCENELMKKVTPGNCLEMYALGEIHGAKLLKEQCWAVIQINKRDIFKDQETFKAFVAQYPDLTFQLFQALD